jgi:hypothetical protein
MPPSARKSSARPTNPGSRKRIEVSLSSAPPNSQPSAVHPSSISVLGAGVLPLNTQRLYHTAPAATGWPHAAHIGPCRQIFGFRTMAAIPADSRRTAKA